MNLKKNLAIALVLVTLCVCISGVSAIGSGLIPFGFEPIDIGEITQGHVDIIHDSGDPDETYKFDIKVDISDLSASNRKSLEDAINKNGTVFVVNTTANSLKVMFTDYNGLDDVHISGDTLYIKNSQTFSYANDANKTYHVTAISFNTTKGQEFYAQI